MNKALPIITLLLTICMAVTAQDRQASNAQGFKPSQPTQEEIERHQHQTGKMALQYVVDKKTQHMTGLCIKSDIYRANWIYSPMINVEADTTIDEATKQAIYDANKRYQWGVVTNTMKPGQHQIKINSSIKRWAIGYNVNEEYTIDNLSDCDIDLSALRICMPWNYDERVNLSSYRCCTIDTMITEDGSLHIAATRLKGEYFGPHIGMVVSKGKVSDIIEQTVMAPITAADIRDHAVSERKVLYLIPEKKILKPKKSYTIRLTFFSYEDKKDFERKANALD